MEEQSCRVKAGHDCFTPPTMSNYFSRKQSIFTIMKKFLLLIILAACLKTASAQEEAIFNHYIFNPVLINPGATGFDTDHHNLFMNIRTAWTAFPGAPKTYALSYNGAITKKLGLGGMLYTESIGAITTFRGQLSYAFQHQVNEDFRIGAGLATDFQRIRVDNDMVDNPLYDPNDNIVEQMIDGERIFDATIGIYGGFRDIFYFGYSAPNLIRARLDNIEGDGDGGQFQYFTFNFGGKFELPEQKVFLEPSILIKRLRDVPFQVDFNMLANFLDEQLIAGLAYRAGTGGNLGLILGTKFNTLRFIYTYDVYFDTFQQYSNGTHEFTVNFLFDRKQTKFDRSKKYRK